MKILTLNNARTCRFVTVILRNYFSGKYAAKDNYVSRRMYSQSQRTQSQRYSNSHCRLHCQCSLSHSCKPCLYNFSSNVQHYSTETENVNLLLKHLQSRIKAGGPITVAEYMKEVLTNSLSGYYMHRDVFGAAGDFITSPEISQMFGELLSVWVVNEWMNHYNDKHIQIVELGPGRGTLTDDMLRVFAQFPAIKNNISVAFVEVSPALSRMQAEKVTGKNISDFSEKESEPGATSTPGPYRQVTSKYGPVVTWYTNLADVPQGLSCYIAHEFLDALPIHKFHRTEHGWREVLVDVDAGSDSLRFVLAPGQTPASVAYLKDVQTNDKSNIEVCPRAGMIVQDIAKRIDQHGGFCLLADYGHTGEKGGTFRAFKNHALHDPLVDPGTADLTADVDFSYLKKMISDEVTVFGPVTQARFLNNMGIGLRLQTLLQRANQDQWSSLVSGYRMLTSPEQMGERFKFMCVMPKLHDQYIPAGFADLDLEGLTNRQNK